MKIFDHRINIRKPAFAVTIFLFIFLFVLSQGAAVNTMSSNHVEKSNKHPEKGKKTDEAILLLSASATISSFHIHFDHIYKLTLNIPDIMSHGRRAFCHFPVFFNDYFQTLFQFIIASHAP
jgi:hypothetical protein